MRTDRRTGLTKLIVAYRNFSKERKNDRIIQVFRFTRFIYSIADIMALALCRVMSLCRRFGGTRCLRLHGDWTVIKKSKSSNLITGFTNHTEF